MAFVVLVCRIGQIVQFCCFFWTNCPHLCHIKALDSMYCVHSSEWGLFGRNTRSAIQGTSSSPPTRGTSELKKKRIVWISQKRTLSWQRRDCIHEKSRTVVRLFCIYSRKRVPCSITLCPNWCWACAGSCGSAIERSRERQRRVRLPLVDIA